MKVYNNMYVLNSLYTESINLISTFKECLFIEIKLKNKTKLLFGCIYRSDGGGVKRKGKSDHVRTVLLHLIFCAKLLQINTIKKEAI